MSDDRFWAKVSTKGDGCWEYMGARNTSGYGWMMRDSKNVAAHRHSWQLSVGPIPPHKHVLHRCDNPACVRPEHLYLGDHAQNMRDRADRRRAGRQKLSVSDVAEIRKMRGDGATCQQIADKFHISNGHASSVARGIHYGRE